MKSIFISNYFNHHQKPLSDALTIHLNQDYRFIETGEMTQEREALGWNIEHSPEYLVQADKSSYEETMCADVVISGSAPEAMLRRRIRAGKLIFRYSERPLKHGLQPLKYLPRLLKWHYRNPPGKPIYMLCASAYAAGDYRKFGLFRNRCYKWGYFPETRKYPDLDKLFAGKSPTTILWCGRFLDWKHPDDVLKIAGRLKKAGVPFALKLVGTGPMENALRQWVLDNALGDCVAFLGTMPPEKVRDCMEQAGIFLFTSDRREGWGAVVNEAMNSGCAVVASDAAGSVPYLIQDKENGLVYHSGNTDELFERVKGLLDHPAEQRRLGEAAYRTIADLWNAEIAAKRLIALSKAILDGDASPELFEDGPCSRAEIIREDWYIE